ncbi:MAG: glycosyltransferase family 39 protein [bacterium]
MRALKTIIGGLSAYYILVYLFVAFSRLNYPFDLDFVDGANLQSVLRVLSWQNLYVAPSLDFIPNIYNPLYYYLAAPLAKVLGPTFLPLRLLSLLASLGCFGLIYRLIEKETGNKYYGFVAAGFFAATFNLCGGWFDMPRVDSLFLFFTLFGLYQLRQDRLVASAILFALAFFTKQFTLAVVIPMIIYLLIFNRSGCLKFTLVFGGLTGVGISLLNIFSNGWYSYYAFWLPAMHSRSSAVIGFWLFGIICSLPIVFLLKLFLFNAWHKQKNREKGFYFAIFCGLMGAGWLGLSHSFAHVNVLMPAFAALAIILGLVLAEFQLTVLAQILIIGQFAWLFYNPLAYIPTQNDRLANEKIVKIIKETKGEVFIPRHNYLAGLAGKRIYAHWMAIHDVLRGDSGGVGTALFNEIQTALKTKKFKLVVMDEEDKAKKYKFWDEDSGEYYLHKVKISLQPDELWPVAGVKTRPTYLLY